MTTTIYLLILSFYVEGNAEIQHSRLATYNVESNCTGALPMYVEILTAMDSSEVTEAKIACYSKEVEVPF